MPQDKATEQIYYYVRDELPFGYNSADALQASAILADGYGQCNTKGIVFMALLRAIGVRCRLHGFTIAKPLQKGALSGLAYLLSPSEIIHSWVEVYMGGRWINVEGFIIDRPYLKQLQQKFPQSQGAFCGYGVATLNFLDPPIDWSGDSTYIQKEGIVQDFGTFDSPDDFFAHHHQQLSPLKRLAFQIYARPSMNRNVRRIRDGA